MNSPLGLIQKWVPDVGKVRPSYEDSSCQKVPMKGIVLAAFNAAETLCAKPCASRLRTLDIACMDNVGEMQGGQNGRPAPKY